MAKNLSRLITQRIAEVQEKDDRDAPQELVQVNARLSVDFVVMLDHIARELELSRSGAAGLLLAGAIVDALDDLPHLRVIIEDKTRQEARTPEAEAAE
jgi:hypothetical protein